MPTKKKSAPYTTVKDYAKHLMLKIVDTDDDGRFVGLSYGQILQRIRTKFPTITYNGPHKGRPIKMTVKQLREIAYTMQSVDRTLRLPVRPRSDRKKKHGRRVKSTTTNTPPAKKAAPVKPATTPAPKD